MFILEIALDEIASVQSRSTVERHLYYEGRATKLKLTIIIFIKVEIVDGVQGFLLSTIVRLVGMIKS